MGGNSQEKELVGWSDSFIHEGRVLSFSLQVFKLELSRKIKTWINLVDLMAKVRSINVQV